MNFTCPECDTRIRGDTPGAVVACPGCSNPVAVPQPRAKPASRPLPDAPVPGTVRHRNPWATAGLVLTIVALAHVGLYLLLTIEARSERSELEDRYGAGALEAAERPEPQPETAASPEELAAELRTWNKTNKLWLAAKDYAAHSKHVTLLRTGFLFSFLVQVCITGWILMKVVGRRTPQAA